jgi:hypothetical protein
MNPPVHANVNRPVKESPELGVSPIRINSLQAGRRLACGLHPVSAFPAEPEQAARR